MQALAPFLSGLGLFFCGVHFVSSHLVPLAGRRLRRLLMKTGGRPLLAAVFGSLAGLVTQSSSAVIAVIIGLVGGGLVDKRRAVLIPTWSHVGLSVLVILVAIDFRLAASYLIAIAGIAVYFGFDRSDRVRHGIGILLGLGLLFVGMQMLKDGTVPLREALLQDGFIAAVAGHPPLLLLLGAALSFVCQSSAVAGALAVAGASTGLIDLPGAAWIVYGANLGSAVNFAILARAHRGEAAQIALMQVVQKLAGFVVVFVVIVLDRFIGIHLIEETARSLAHTVAGQVAWVFLFYQLAGSAFCTLFVGRILPILERLAPPSELQALSKPEFLIEDALIEPSFALELVGREETRLLVRLPHMLDTVRAEPEGKITLPKILRTASLSVTGAMGTYLGSIFEARLESEDREQAVRLQHRTANLAAMFESLEDFVVACTLAREWASSGKVADLMIESLHTLLIAAADAAASNDPEERKFTLALLSHRDELMERIRLRILRDDPDMPAKPQQALFTATTLFERVIWLARRNALLLSPEAGAT